MTSIGHASHFIFLHWALAELHFPFVARHRIDRRLRHSPNNGEWQTFVGPNVWRMTRHGRLSSERFVIDPKALCVGVLSKLSSDKWQTGLSPVPTVSNERWDRARASQTISVVVDTMTVPKVTFQMDYRPKSFHHRLDKNPWAIWKCNHPKRIALFSWDCASIRQTVHWHYINGLRSHSN